MVAWNIAALPEYRMRRECIERLNKIVQVADPLVVATTTWRERFAIEKLEGFLKLGGYTGVVDGATPVLGSRQSVARGLEIHQWLLEHDIRSPFCILDDDNDMVHLSHRLVQTKTDIGLTDADVRRALVLLGSHA